MKILHYISIEILMLTLCSVSCSIHKIADETTTFSGKIRHNGTREIRIENEDTMFSSLVDEKGLFSITFNLEKESVFTYVGNEFIPVYLAPGDRLFMSVDAQTWRTFDKTLVFSGKGSKKNNYFFHKSLLIDALSESGKDALFAMDESDFLVALDSVFTVLKGNYRALIKAHPHLSRKQLKVERENIEFLRNDIILRYYLNNGEKKNKTDKITTLTDEIISNIDVNNKNYRMLDAYNDLIIDYFRVMLQRNHIEDENKKLAYVLVNIDTTIGNNEIKASVSGYFIKMWISKGYVNRSTLEDIRDQLDPDFYNRCIKLYNEEKPLVVNDKAPECYLYDTNGNEYTLSNFKGSYVYIDVWASYCGPCLKEVPFLEQLKKDFQGKNIVFISISLDRKEKDWLSSIQKYNMTDYQLRPENDWSSDFVRKYSMNYYGIPHYIIIDPKGTIIKMPGPVPSEAAAFLKQIL